MVYGNNSDQQEYNERLVSVDGFTYSPISWISVMRRYDP